MMVKKVKNKNTRNLNKNDCMYKEIFNNKHTSMLIIDPKTGQIYDANKAACNFYGYDYKDFIRMNIYEINVSDKSKTLSDMKKAKDENNKWFRFKHRTSSGDIKDVEVFSGPIKYNGRELLFSIIHNVEELITLESEFSSSKLKHESLFNNSYEAIAILDENFAIADINKSFNKIFQYELEEIKGQDITSVVCDEDLCHISYDLRERTKEGHIIKAEVVRKRKDGSPVEVTLMLIPIMINNKVDGIYCIYIDMTDIKSKEMEINKLINKDKLTNLDSKKSFIENISRNISEKANKKKFAILTLSINELNDICSALGNEIGDEVLKRVAKVLEKKSISENVPSRIANNIFSILLPNIKSIEEAELIANKFKEQCNKKFKIDDYEFDCTVSAGISIYPDDSIQELELIEKSKLALNKSIEELGKYTVKYEEFLVKELQESFWLKQNLAHAIKNNELILNYQPIYDTQINKLIGSEALLRWRHKEIGIIPPMKFIPLAEETGLIHAIGKWVIYNACKQNKEWHDIGYQPIYISVNSSILELKDENFVDSVKQVLEDTKLDPKYLQIEITESFSAENYEPIRDNIKELKEIGVKIAIDDFGTGYSSLGKLNELNVNSLKIDKSFIDEIQTNENKRKIVEAIILLSKTLNLDTIAEGVEYKEQMNILKTIGCNLAQGFYFSKAIESKEFEKLFEK